MIIIFILGVVFRECILVILSFILRVCFLTEIIGGICCSMNIIIWRRCLGFILWWKAKEFHCCNEAWKRKLPKNQTAVIQDWMCESNTSTVHACVKYLYSVKMLTSNIANLGRYRPLLDWSYRFLRTQWSLWKGVHVILSFGVRGQQKISKNNSRKNRSLDPLAFIMQDSFRPRLH